MAVGIDSNILIYAGIVPAKNGGISEESKELSIRSKLLLYDLHQSRIDIILPNICVSEILIPVHKSKTMTLVTKLAERFICAPFDIPSATIASELWSRYKELPKDQQYEKRQVMKADAMIVASAKAAGATAFYSPDARCRKMASLIMRSLDLPENSDDLFTRADIERGDLDI